MNINYTRTYYLQCVRDQLLDGLQSGEDARALRDSVYKTCERMREKIASQKKGYASWDSTEAEKECLLQLDGMRYLLSESVAPGLMIQKLETCYSFLNAADYPIRVVFFCQEYDLFPSFQSVWDAFSDTDLYDRKAVFVWENAAKEKAVTQYVYTNRKLYKDAGIPIIDVKEYDLTRDQPDLCFFLKPYYGNRGLPCNLQIAEVNRHAPFTVFISYCLDIQGGAELREYFYEQQAFYDFWKIIGYSPFYKEMMTRYGFRNGENVEAIGHPKFDGIYQMMQNNKWEREEWKIQIAGRPVVMWNSHFSITPGKGVGTFLLWQDTIFNYFKHRKDMVLLWRPHPIFWKNIETETAVDTEIFRQRMQELKSMDNVIIDRYGDYHYAFAASNALISDAATFLVEFTATGRPVMYTPKPDGEGVCDPNCIQHLYIGNTAQDIISYLDGVRKGEDPMREARISDFEKEYGQLDGRIGERIRNCMLRAMLEDIEAETERTVHNSTTPKRKEEKRNG